MVNDALKNHWGEQPGTATKLTDTGSSGGKLLEIVRIYHSIDPGEEQGYRSALISAYKAFRRNS
jgi:hypothetical protein